MEDKGGVMVINDTTRIKETLPTLKLLVGNGARVVLMAHLGRPDGKREPSLSLAPVAAKLGEMLGQPVGFVDETVGSKAEAAVAALVDGQVLILENVRFHAEEEANDPVFAARLARLPTFMSMTPLAPPIAPMRRPVASRESSKPGVANVPPGC
jgi:phosphoglycerate kinase